MINFYCKGLQIDILFMDNKTRLCYSKEGNESLVMFSKLKIGYNNQNAYEWSSILWSTALQTDNWSLLYS